MYVRDSFCTFGIFLHKKFHASSIFKSLSSSVQWTLHTSCFNMLQAANLNLATHLFLLIILFNLNRINLQSFYSRLFCITSSWIMASLKLGLKWHQILLVQGVFDEEICLISHSKTTLFLAFAFQLCLHQLLHSNYLCECFHFVVDESNMRQLLQSSWRSVNSHSLLLHLGN